MKILVASSSGIYDAAYPETKKKNTGFNHMIRAYADMLCKNNDRVDILTQAVFTKGRKIGGASLLKRTWADLFLHIRPFYLIKAVRFFLKAHIGISTKCHMVFYYLNGAFCEALIKKNRYDVVHINGCGIAAIPYMYACARTKTPCVTTLHGLVSFDSSVEADVVSKKTEKNFLVAQKKNANILSSVVSSGIKKRIMTYLNLKKIDNINVICNPYIPFLSKEDVSVTGKRIIVCIGNISENKNQKLAVDAFAVLNYPAEDMVYLYIIGGNEAALVEYVKEKGIKNVVFTGSIPRQQVMSYLDGADVCIMTTRNEGFGLSIVEGYAHGVPGILSETVDAFEDLYDERTMVPFHTYTPECVADAIQTALKKNWDTEYIRKATDRFSFDACSKQYLDLLSNAVAQHCSISVAEVNSLERESF